MKKLIFTLSSVVMLLSVTFVSAVTQNVQFNENYQDTGNSDCWQMAIDMYHNHEETGHSREDCIEIAIFTYDLCVELEED